MNTDIEAFCGRADRINDMDICPEYGKECVFAGVFHYQMRVFNITAVKYIEHEVLLKKETGINEMLNRR